MSFSENLLYASLSFINPAFGIFGSIIKYAISDENNADKIFVLDLIGNFLPGGLTKDILYNSLLDCYEMNSISDAIDDIVPYNAVALKCSECNLYVNYYISNKNQIICSHCYSNSLSNFNTDYNHFTLKNNIYSIHNRILQSNTLEGRLFEGRNLEGKKLNNRRLT